ncbi:MAG: MaoC family dehydratase [Pseudomonadota bacterium]|nr:MaoC family dehydratase [Pseudomonadota bacterium]
MQSLKEAYLEDYKIGLSYEFGSIEISKDDIVSFAKKFDPQYFHLDEELAEASQFNGLIASGWHTCSIMMRLLVQNFISECSSLGSPGVDKIRWLEPVRPGDSLSIKVKVIENRRSKSKPDRGIVRSKIEVLNRQRVVVLNMETTGFFLSRKISN